MDLPPGCASLSRITRCHDLHKTHCVQVCNGNIMFLQNYMLGGEGALMLWTLVHGADGEYHWMPKPDYTMRLSEISAPTARQLMVDLLVVALVRPHHANIIYIWHGSHLVAVDARAKTLTACGDPSFAHDTLVEDSSRSIHVWELP